MATVYIDVKRLIVGKEIQYRAYLIADGVTVNQTAAYATSKQARSVAQMKANYHGYRVVR